MARFSVVFKRKDGEIQSMIKHGVGKNKTAESILDDFESLAILGTVLERFDTGKVVKLTAKRAIISGLVGYMGHFTTFDEKQDFYLKPPGEGRKKEKMKEEKRRKEGRGQRERRGRILEDRLRTLLGGVSLFECRYNRTTARAITNANGKVFKRRPGYF
jgi:hypothetical protein